MLRYFQQCENLLPHHYIPQDTNHLTLANFTVSGLELLNAPPTSQEKKLSWVYAHLLDDGSGFRGSLQVHGNPYDVASLPATYFAVTMILTLNGSLDRLDRVVDHLSNLQNTDGSFSATKNGASDVRFSYMVFAIMYILKATGDVDVPLAMTYLDSCRTFDGAYGESPGAEAHAGLTFCVVAAKFLAGYDVPERDDLVRWLCQRQNQDGGFNGRVGKDSDVCYCFWTVSTLAVLGQSHLIDRAAVLAYLDTCQSKIGGYGKSVGEYPDVYHSYLGLAVKHILDDPEPIHCALSVSSRVLARIQAISS